jgi:hypothetical protein
MCISRARITAIPFTQVGRPVEPVPVPVPVPVDGTTRLSPLRFVQPKSMDLRVVSGSTPRVLERERTEPEPMGEVWPAFLSSLLLRRMPTSAATTDTLVTSGIGIRAIS